MTNPKNRPTQSLLRRLTVLLLIGLPILSIIAVFNLEQESDITRFLPDNQIKDHLRISRIFEKTSLARSMVLLIEFPDKTSPDTMCEISDRFSDSLLQTGQFKKVRNGRVSTGQEKLYYDLYFNRRFNLYSLNPESEIPGLFSDDSLREIPKTLAREIAGPMGMAIKRIAGSDPFLAFSRLLKSIQTASTLIAPSMHLGRFCSPSESAMLILAETIANPFDNRSQKELIDETMRRFESLKVESGMDITLEYTGINRFSLDAERLIRNDINLAFIISVVLIVLIFRTAYHSARLSLITFLPLALGVLVSIGVSSLIYQKLHGLTIAFGSTLIGICIDYPIHIINHRRFGTVTGDQLKTSNRSLIQSLLMCFLTTLTGYIVIALSGFPGIRQMAVCSMIGLIYSFVFSVVLFPRLLDLSVFRTVEAAPATHFSSRLIGGLCVLHRNRKWTILVFGLITLGILFTLHSINIHTDIRMLNSSDPRTREIDAKIQSLMKSHSFQSVLVVSAETLENALNENERVYRELEELKSEGVINEFFSCVPFIRSRDLQFRNLSAFQSAATPERLDRFQGFLSETGFDPVRFEDFFKVMRDSDVDPLTIDAFKGTDIAELISSFIIIDNQKTFVLNLLQTELTPEMILEQIESRPGMYVFRQIDLLNDAITSSQAEMLILIGTGLLFIFFILWFYYRSLRKTAAAILPSLFAGLFTLAIIGIFEPSVNMMHIVATLLILCMGVDYGIFMTDSVLLIRIDPHAVSLATRSVILTSLTTLVSFGSLALTNNGALQSIGFAVFAGILSAAVASIGFNTILFSPVKDE